MIPAERRQKILRFIKEGGAASINTLSSLMNVSEATIRRDLDELSKDEFVIRSHGGAINRNEGSSTVYEPGYHSRIQANIDEKKKIAFKAAERVGNGLSIILDSGSTALEIAKCLHGKERLTVVTIDIRVAMELARLKGVQVIVTGGILREGLYTLFGPHAESLLDELSVDLAFLSAYGIDESGVTTVNPFQVPVKRKMIKVARRVIVTADHSKFGKRLFTRICTFDEVDEIITDNKLDPKYKEFLEKEGHVKITMA